MSRSLSYSISELTDCSKLNRIKSRSLGIKSKYWCPICDSSLVGQFGKCPTCHQSNTNKIKF